MIWLWIGFIAFIIVLLVVDLGVIHRGAHTVSPASAMRWVAFFIALGLVFNVAVYFIYQHDWLGFGSSFTNALRLAAADEVVQAGGIKPEQMGSWQPPAGSVAAREIAAPGLTAALQFLTGWLTEYALSIDNIFVIAVVFGHFRVPAQYQHRVLFWGILGALVMRGAMILGGTTLIARFHWLLYVFGAFLILTAIKLAISREDKQEDFEKRPLIRGLRKLVPVSSGFDGQKFLTRLSTGALAATPLLLVLIIVEATDLVFALDSIPAILGITTDPFLVFTSNVFAILGLRSLFFALSGMMSKFEYLKYSLAAILGFVGAKMLLEMPVFDVEIPAAVSLGVIAGALGIGVGASLWHARRQSGAAPAGRRNSHRS